MSKYLPLIITTLLMCVSHSFELTKDEYMLGGIQVNEPDHDKWVSSLKHHNMNTVSVTVYANSGVWNSEKLYYKDKDEGALLEIKAAKDKGLRVVFIPRVALDHYYPENNELWHGMIMPETDQQLRQWFATYQEYVLKWAKIAEEHDIEVFAIGSELKALTHTHSGTIESILGELQGFEGWYQSYPQRIKEFTGDTPDQEELHTDVTERSSAYLNWAQEVYHAYDPENNITLIQKRRALLLELWNETIDKVRDVYSGQLTYAANYDTYHNIAFWPSLDIMGINAYFQLRTDIADLSQEMLNESWANVMANILSFKTNQNITEQPVIFTELGYSYRKNCSVEPWSYEGKSIVENNGVSQLIDWNNQPPDHSERLMCLTALKQAALKPENSFLRGLLYWKLSTLKEHEKIENFVLHIAPETEDRSVEVLRNIFQ